MKELPNWTATTQEICCLLWSRELRKVMVVREGSISRIYLPGSSVLGEA